MRGCVTASFDLVKEALGHASPVTTRVYASVRNGAVVGREPVDLVGGWACGVGAC